MSRTTRPGGVAACAVATLLVLAILLPAGASARSLQFGAWTPGDPYNGSTSGASALEAATGRRVDIVNWYQNWGGGSWVSSVQANVIGAVTGGGRTPMLTWEPWVPGAGTNQPSYSLARIAAGDFDTYISTWALALKVLGAPVYLRPMHEMNSDWYPWSGAANGNSPDHYVQAWRHIVDVFRARGASNVRFVWSPNNIDVPASNRMESYYPGASYVDVLAADGYNWGAGTPEFGGWQSFDKVFRDVYDRLRALGPQPIWFAEVATSDDGGDKAAWVRDMFTQAQSMDRLEALVWFNEHKERDWRAAPTPEIAAAFAPGAVSAPAATRTSRAKARPKLI
ncbi:MAG TPA: glycosyl hydrolase, partial [Solirubrobacteraceae bacterium]|nr:glycosyl hydrolase [Solirubrobacteraceae bacterium]